MSIPDIHLRPNDDGDEATVIINGHTTGTIWMMDRGCAYKHTNMDFQVSSDCMQILVMIMRGIEAFVAPVKT